MYYTVATIILLFAVSYIDSSVKWDAFIFSQHWLETACIEWHDKGPNHNCTLQANETAWGVHGLWPTKSHNPHRHYPAFCNFSRHFNVSAVAPIVTQLEVNWPNIHAHALVSSLWKHEWIKHGTCALQHPDINSELDYFSLGLTLHNKFNVSKLLIVQNIVPGKNYTGPEIWNSLKANIGKNPSINCILDSSNKRFYLSQIKICFDFNMALVDCDNISGGRGPADYPLGNCRMKAPVTYPIFIPNHPLAAKTALYKIRT